MNVCLMYTCIIGGHLKRAEVIASVLEGTSILHVYTSDELRVSHFSQRIVIDLVTVSADEKKSL